MTKRTGWWRFYRKIWENPYMDRPAYFSVWCWLLSEAQWQEGKRVIFNGQPIELKPGQLTCGRKQISMATGVPSGTVQRILKCLKNEHQIEQRTDHQKRLITVINWKEYQNDEQDNEQRMNNEWTTNEQRMNTTEEYKKLKNIKHTNNLRSKNAGAVQKKDLVNTIFDRFHDTINPTINYANKTSRQAAKKLIDKFGIDTVLRMVDYAVEVHGEKYAPQISTPYQLSEKLPSLKSYYEKEQDLIIPSA